MPPGACISRMCPALRALPLASQPPDASIAPFHLRRFWCRRLAPSHWPSAAWRCSHAAAAPPWPMVRGAGLVCVCCCCCASLHAFLSDTQPSRALPAAPPALSLATRMGCNARQKGEVGRCMVVLVTDGRANVSLARSSREQGQYGPDAITPPQVGRGRRLGLAWLGGSPVRLLLLLLPMRAAGARVSHMTSQMHPCCLSARQEELEQEVLAAARRLGASGLKLLVIDTGGWPAVFGCERMLQQGAATAGTRGQLRPHSPAPFSCSSNRPTSPQKAGTSAAALPSRLQRPPAAATTGCRSSSTRLRR